MMNAEQQQEIIRLAGNNSPLSDYSLDALRSLIDEARQAKQLWSGASKDIAYLQYDGATWKGLFEDMRQKCDTARAERDALAAELATVRAQLAQGQMITVSDAYKPQA